MSNVFKTTVLGVGPWCVEFGDGEIVHCRAEGRAKLIAAAPLLLEALKGLLSSLEESGPWSGPNITAARAAIAKATA